MNVKNDICVIRDSLLDWLREHRHGVMGTVIFHLVLAIFLVCVGISRLDSQQRMEIEIDMPEPEIVQQKQEEQEKKEQILRQSADEEVNEMLRSLAVNEDVVKKNAEPPPHERVKEYIQQRNPQAKVFPISAKTGEGMDAWTEWLAAQVTEWKK